MSNRRAKARAIATEFVNTVNANTVCARCLGGPIEWHGEHHPDKPNARISSLRAQGVSIARIQAEMDICTPLCRSCHMKEDGRGIELQLNKPNQPGAQLLNKLPCGNCMRLFKPLRKGLCYTCYEKQRCGSRTHISQGGCCVAT